MRTLFIALLIAYAPWAFSANTRNMSYHGGKYHNSHKYQDEQEYHEGEDDPGILKDARHGNAGAQYSYGMIQYQKGHYNEAAKWFLKAANQNHEYARYQLGKMYVNGKGVPVNYLRAYFLFAISEEQGLSESANAKRSLARSMSHHELKEAREMVTKYHKGEHVY